jgi:hypothetical protein
MNSLTEVRPVESAISSGTPSQRFFKFCYLSAIGVTTVGWLSAFGWITVRVAKWLMA